MISAGSSYVCILFPPLEFLVQHSLLSEKALKEHLMKTPDTPTRIALIGIIVENPEITDQLNLVLHDYARYIIGRMGVPYRPKNLCIISIILDAPAEIISSLSGKLGMLDGISVKTVYTRKDA